MQIASSPDGGEIYTNGYAEPALNFMRRRSLASHGRFIEPFLRPGLRLLDLGCGPGTLTADLARRVRPGGSVVGVDQHEEQFQPGQAAVEGLSMTFRAMNAYRLDFAAATFDGVFSHALFEHLARPLDVLAEIRRVLKPDGFVGLRSPDWGGMVIHPSDRKLRAALAARTKLQTRNGGNVLAGRHLGEWLRHSGFAEVRVTASYEIYPDVAPIVDHVAAQLENDGQTAPARTWRQWGKIPEAMFAQSWFEATGYKRT